jgi:hypothetical protein
MDLRRWKLAAPWLSLIVLLLIPLYAVSAALIIRSGLFNLQDRSISGEEIKALWAFIAAGLATGGTVVGLLLTRSYNDRTLQQTTLDTVVKGLELLVNDDGSYAKRPKVAGALAALVHLGHPVIAMRTLSPAWEEGAVDPATASWLISEVFKTGSPQSQAEAAELLFRHASELTSDEKGKFHFPDVLMTEWPQHLTSDVRGYNLLSIIKLLVSRKRDWWGTESNWIILILDEIRLHDGSGYLRYIAASALKPIADTYPEQESIWRTKGGERRLSEIRTELSAFEPSHIVTEQTSPI